MNHPRMLLPMHLSQYIPCLVFTEIALPIFKMLVAKMSHCCVVSHPLLSTLVLQEQLVAKALEAPFWFRSMQDMLFGFL
jgi:hypothetical protein